MASTINASTSSGIVSSADTSGILQLQTASTTAVTIDASQNVGIGTSSPAVSGLQIAKTLDPIIRLTDNRGPYNFDIKMGGATAVINNTASGPMTFSTNNAEAMRIDSSGNLLVGATDATVGGGSAGIKNTIGTNPRISIVTNSSTSSTALSVYSLGASAYRFFVEPNGTVYATNTTISGISDQRYKENIVDLDVGLDKIMKLKPRKFDWKAGKGKDIKNDRGFIAQEFEQVFPDLIDEWKDPAPEGEKPYKSVRADLIPVLVKAIQELKAELDATKAEVAALKTGA